MNQTDRHQYQFELWEECNSKCSFCYLGNLNRKTTDEKKLDNLQKTLDIIKDPKLYETIDCLGYIGGEFFQGQLKDSAVYSKFMELMDQNNHLLMNGSISSMWMSASLLIGDQHELFAALSRFSAESIAKIWILTSYDTIGRFYSQSELEHWKDNIRQLKCMYPQIQINITTIVTGDFINKYLSQQLTDLDQIVSECGCSQFLKPACDISNETENTTNDYSELDRITMRRKKEINQQVGEFFPTRSAMLKFLTRYRQMNSEFAYDKLFNPQYRAEYLQLFGSRYTKSHRLREQYQEEFTLQDTISQSRPVEKCQHGSQYMTYVDSTNCLICDKFKVAELVQ